MNSTQFSPAGFQYVHTMEPHHRRRVALLSKHPEIRSLFGFDRTTIAMTLAVAALQLSLAAALAKLDAAWWVTLLTAYALGAIISHWLGQTIHETAHHLAARTPLGNQALAWFANVPMLFPIAATFHRYHLDHHRYLGHEARDTDLPHALEVKLVGNSRIKKAVWLFLYFFVYSLRGLTFVKRPNRAEVLNALVQLAATAAIAQMLGSTAIIYLAASTIFGHSLHPIAAHFIHEHYELAPGQETLSYYGPLNWFSFNVGHHVEHHDFMAVPGSRLPALRAMARGSYDSLVSHRSWSVVLWHFISSKALGVGNRLVRTEEDFARARAPGGVASQPMPSWGQS